jgi:dihydrofolate synthase/folylpolyglutamate synthase
VVERAARAAGAELWRLGEEVRFSSRWRGWDGSELDVEVAGRRHHGLRVPLLGSFQGINAALAVAAAEAAGDASPRAVAEGIAATAWPGRLELVEGWPRVLLDGGHNPAGLEQIGPDVLRLAGDARLVVVFGAMGDKDLAAMLDRLRPMAPAGVVFTRAQSAGARAADPDWMAAVWGRGAEVVLPAAAALERARELAGGEGTVLTCGSLYLVGELRPMLVRA